MKRSKQDPFELEKPEYPHEPQYYEMTGLVGDAYNGTHYVRLRNEYNDRLDSRVKISILWPDGETSEHAITTETTKDQDALFSTDYYVWPYIDLRVHGTIIKVKLTEIKGIRVRIIYSHN